MTTNVGAGLAPARAGPRDPPGRAHPRRRRRRAPGPAPRPSSRRTRVPSCHRLRPRRPVAVHDGGRGGRDPDRVAARRRPRHSGPAAGPARRHQGAHRRRSRPPRAARRARRRDPGRVVAAGHRRRGRRAAPDRRRRHARQEHDRRAGWSTSSWPAARTRARSSGRSCRRDITGGAAGDGALGRRARLRRRGGRVRRQLRCLPAGHRDPDLRRVGPPGRLRRRRRGRRRVRGLASSRRPTARPSSPTSATPASSRSWSAWRVSDAAGDRPLCRRARRGRTPAGRGRTSRAGSPPPMPAGRPSRSTASRPTTSP